MEKGKTMDNTREKLIELIKKPIAIMPGRIGTPDITLTMPYAEELADHLIANGVTLDNQVSSSKWISVAERLPDKNGEYLCRHTDKSVHSAEYESIYGSFGYWFGFWEDEYKEWIAYEGVTHWMPLPQPPKGE